MSVDWHPGLTASALLRFDPVRQSAVLSLPERLLLLNGPAGTILRLCDGRRQVGEIACQVQGMYGEGEPGGRSSPVGCAAEEAPQAPPGRGGLPGLGAMPTEPQL